MKILITSIIDLKKTAHNRLHQFIKYLSQNNEITVLSINDWWKVEQADVELYSKGLEDVLQGIDIKYFTNRKISPFLQELFSVATLDELLKKIDYKRFDVHLNYNTLVSGCFVTRKLKKIDINTVYDVADDLTEMIRISPQIPYILRPPGAFAGDIMFKKNIKDAARVTYATQHLRDAYPAPPGRAEIIANGTDIQLFTSRPVGQLRKKLGIGDGFLIGYVGTLREWVDFEPLFMALKQLNKKHPDIRLLIVGEEGGIGRVGELARSHKILDRVTFTGTVPYAEVVDYISCMDMGVIPFGQTRMAEEPCPLKLFEYMACEKPVISSRSMSVANNKVLYAANTEEYIDKITELYENRELGKRLGKEGRQFVEQNHSWQKLAADMEKVLLEVSR